MRVQKCHGPSYKFAPEPPYAPACVSRHKLAANYPQPVHDHMLFHSCQQLLKDMSVDYLTTPTGFMRERYAWRGMNTPTCPLTSRTQAEGRFPIHRHGGILSQKQGEDHDLETFVS
jgi:hypothetical protein